MQTGGKPAAANDLTEILATLSGWGYPSKVVEKHYENLTPMMKDLSLEEKAARVAEGIDAERRRVEDEIRKVPTPPTDTANEDPGWPEVLKGAMVMALFGPMGSGKSTTAHFCLELLRDKGTPYLVLYPGMPRPPVPPWIRMVDDLEEVPPDAIILLDEASLVYHSRESATAAAKLMSKWIGLVRQRHQALIILGRLGSEIDKNLVSYSDAVGIKKPLEGQGAFERPALRGVLQEAEAAFRKVEGDARAFTWVWDRRSGEKKMVQNTMPTYWSEDLSEAFAKAPLGAVDNIPPRQNKRSPR